MIWVGFLIACFVMIGASTRLPEARKRALLFAAVITTLGIVFVGFGRTG